MTVVDVVRARVADGQHRWGRLVVRPVDRTLWSSRTLTVFAPGTSRRERAWLRAWHAWVVVGAVAAVVTLAVTSALPAGVAFGAAALVYAAGFVVLGTVTRRSRRQERSVTVTVHHGEHGATVHGDVRLLEGSLDTLTLLERAVQAGRRTPVELEVAWADVWNALPPR
jgi:hypothetical protein